MPDIFYKCNTNKRYKTYYTHNNAYCQLGYQKCSIVLSYTVALRSGMFSTTYDTKTGTVTIEINLKDGTYTLSGDTNLITADKIFYSDGTRDRLDRVSANASISIVSITFS